MPAAEMPQTLSTKTERVAPWFHTIILTFVFLALAAAGHVNERLAVLMQTWSVSVDIAGHQKIAIRRNRDLGATRKIPGRRNTAAGGRDHQIKRTRRLVSRSGNVDTLERRPGRAAGGDGD